MTKDEALQLLRTSINNPTATFHEDQWEAIDALVNYRKKMLVVERTGWGKSSVYFIATRALRDKGFGVTIIISPLLALMRNQIVSAERLGITAVTVNSTNIKDWQLISQQLLNNQVDALLISPEKLANEKFMETVLMPLSNKIGLFVVDEAHCISDWGHDFRPDYQRITRILQQMPSNMPVLATTATANDRVVEDIENQIGGIETIRGTLVRDSLILQNIKLPNQASRLAWIVGHINSIKGAGIIYTSTKRDADMLSIWLNQNNINSLAYYSGIVHEEFEDKHLYRQYLEDMLMNNQIKVLVATTALGMGYDKPDLGFVIHYQLPASIVAYYQQVGRAGRGISYARGILLSGYEDSDIQTFFINSAFPSEEHVNLVLDILKIDGLSIPNIEEHINLRKGEIEKVLKYLAIQSPSPVYKEASKWYRTAIQYQMDKEKIASLTQLRYEEFAQVEEYLNSKECLMKFLRRELNDTNITDCGKCMNCNPSNALSTSFTHDNGVSASNFLKHNSMPIEVRKQFPTGAFPIYDFKYRPPVNELAEEGRVLSKWQDAGWGKIVAKNKQEDNYFNDELVNAMRDMILHWNPIPKPTWITCIPSLKHKELVPSFAKRLAKELGIPYIEAIIKVKQNQAQKMMENGFYQCSNLDGAFEIQNIIPNEPVFLIDDIVDSRWTFTVLSALLRRSGTGEVFPVALTSTANG